MSATAPLFGVSYDLRQPGRDYAALTQALRNLRAKRLLQSHWALRSNASAAELREYFKTFIDANDRLFVDQIIDWASYNTETTPNAL